MVVGGEGEGERAVAGPWSGHHGHQETGMTFMQRGTCTYNVVC